MVNFYKNPNLYYDPALRNFHGFAQFAKNHVAYDLGFDNTESDTQVIQEAIYKMEKEYTLVLIR